MEAFFTHEGDVEEEHWHDQRGNISFRTLLGATAGTSSFVTGIARLPVGGLLALHRHAPPETYYVLEGRGVVAVDGVDTDVAAGSSVYIPGNVIHGVRNTGSETLRSSTRSLPTPSTESTTTFRKRLRDSFPGGAYRTIIGAPKEKGALP